ncbi:ImmA/IrrE family metallo-endopeptidase [Hydrogenophaga sp. OTU3427]|uniref:ImmA/IrrE family metallo-endopeptidase n=1 Tax=Hydrogenophaga sp. OTU3427 TaxID=3043856 RepID=UPI00313AF96D
MKLIRGFKTYSERLVQNVRTEMGLRELDPMDMDALATHLHIPYWPLSRFLEAANETKACVNVAEIYKSVSAFTFFEGRRRRIVFNDEHGSARHRSNMAHELAHALLQHPARDSGASTDDEERNEAEAAWTGGVLMLPAHQARYIAASRMNSKTAEQLFQLSPEMLRFRLNVTGAAKMAA